jgi:hypothetical protein
MKLAEIGMLDLVMVAVPIILCAVVFGLYLDVRATRRLVWRLNDRIAEVETRLDAMARVSTIKPSSEKANPQKPGKANPRNPGKANPQKPWSGY